MLALTAHADRNERKATLTKGKESIALNPRNLFSRQTLTCPDGYGECDTGQCCPLEGGCCGTFNCANPGWGCCGNEGYVYPLESECCS